MRIHKSKVMNSYSIILLCTVTMMMVCGCVNTPQKSSESKFSNVQQEHFDKMLAANKKKSFDFGNDIQEREFNDSVKLAIGEYMDSTKLFINWKAQIQHISSYETGDNSMALSFELEYAPEEYRKVTFDVNYVVPKDSLDSDKIYKTVKNLRDYSTVYFDGFIRTKANGEAHYNYSLSDDHLMHSYPDFKFFIVDINPESKGDTISGNLRKAIDLSFKAIEPLKQNFRKEISKKESDRRVAEIAPLFKSAKEKLTNEERAYINRLTEALTVNFVYAE